MKKRVESKVAAELNFDVDVAKFTERQMSAVRMLDSGQIKYLLYGGALGGGKLLRLSTPIATPDGWTTMGAIKIGERVFDERGNPCNVVDVSEPTKDKTYILTFSDGAEIVAGASHEWVTETNKDRQKLFRRSDTYRDGRKETRKKRGTGKRPDLALLNSLRKVKLLDSPVSTIKTTQDIANTLKDGEQTNHAIITCKPLNLPIIDLPIEPYVLGAWLGDGTSVNGNITGIDEDIFNLIRYYGYEVSQHKNKYSHCIKKLKSQLGNLGLIGNKHIPDIYLRASKEQRLTLLQGLMDTDGYCGLNGHCEIQLTSKKLIDDVYELICSLGIKVCIRVGISKLYNKDCGEKYRLKFLTEQPVFRLKRKLERQKRADFRGTHNRRYIVDAKEIQPEIMKCIQVDSPSHLYLAGESMIPTHNSYFLRWIAVRLLANYAKDFGLEYVQVMLACEDYPSLKDRQIGKMAREFPQWLGTMYVDHKEYGRCFILHKAYGSGVICLRNLDDPAKYQCYHPDTEILTDSGFKPVGEIREGFFVATMNPETRLAEYLPVTATQEYDYDDELVVSDDYKSHVQFAVTKNHEMLIRSRRKHKLWKVRADELPERFYVPRSAVFVGEKVEEGEIAIPGFKLGRAKKVIKFNPVSFMKFLGWYLSEGSLGSRTRYEIRISQTKPDGVAKLKNDLKDFPYTIYWNDKGAVLYGKALFNYLSHFGKCYDKFIPPEIFKYNSSLKQSLFDALMDGDGHLTKEGRYVFVTTSRRLVDDVSILAIHLGYTPTIIKIRDFKTGRYANAVQTWHVSITKRDTSMCDRVKRVPYCGKVHCVTVPPFHNVLIRYNNRVMWCGQSAEFAAILVDELTKNDLNTFTDLRMRLRWPGIPDMSCVFLGATNPGGIGHAFVKALWMDKIFPDEFLKPMDYSKTFGYIPSKAEDNPYLDDAYWAGLQTLPPHLRAAFRDGSWDLFKGQAFQEWSRSYHVVDPMYFEHKDGKKRLHPEGAPLFMTFDWGFGAPFSIGWWWIDSDGRKYRFSEWYGWSGSPNQGMRISDTEIAAGIIKREQIMGLTSIEERLGLKVYNPQVSRLCDPTCFNKKPDYRGGGQMPSTAEIFMNAGLILAPGDPSRALKYRQFHEHLKVPHDDEGKVNGVPMIQIYSDCSHFIRTVPALILDEHNIEDVETDSEDHVYDEACHIMMRRPVKSEKSAYIINRPPDNITKIADMEREKIFEDVIKAEEWEKELYDY